MMKPKHRAFLAFLVSLVVGCASSFLVAGLWPGLFSRSLFFQVFLLGLVGLVGTIVCFLTLRLWAGRSESVRTALSADLPFSLAIRKVFLAGFLVFPLVLIFQRNMLEFFRLLGGGSVLDPSGAFGRVGGPNLFLAAIVALSVALSGAVVRMKPSRKAWWEALPDGYYIAAIVLVGTIIRLFLIQSIDTQPSSDFLLIHKDAVGIANGVWPDNVYAATHVVITVLFSYLYRIFGPSVIVIKVFNLLLYVLSGVLVYYAGRLIFESRFWAALAALLLVAWPSLAIYSNVLTPEHVFIFLECLLLLVLAVFFKQNKSIEPIRATRYLPWFLLVGILFGLSGLFRPFSELFLVAFVITLLVYGYGVHRGTILPLLFGLTALLAPFFLLGRLPQAIVDRSYHVDMPNIRPCNLLVGLNPKSSGQWNMDDYYLCRGFRIQSRDGSEYMSKVLSVVKDRLDDSKNQLLAFLGAKFSILWTNNYSIVSWGTQTVSGGNPTFILNMAQSLSLLDFALTLLLLAFAVIGAILALLLDVKPIIFFSMLAFFGFNLMEIPFEVQARYRTVVIPLLIVLACWALSALQARSSGHMSDTK